MITAITTKSKPEVISFHYVVNYAVMQKEHCFDVSVTCCYDVSVAESAAADLSTEVDTTSTDVVGSVSGDLKTIDLEVSTSLDDLQESEVTSTSDIQSSPALPSTPPPEVPRDTPVEVGSSNSQQTSSPEQQTTSCTSQSSTITK